MKVKIVSKPSSQIATLVEKISTVLKQTGYTVTADEEPDVIVAIGGDGTLLRAIKLGKPVIAVKAGRRGILMDVQPDSINEVIKRLERSDYEIEEYPLLEVIGEGFSAISFNEVGLFSDRPETVILNISFLQKDITIEGDGILVATPQGTTGWSLSATGNTVYGLKAMEIALVNPVLSPLKSVVIPFTEISIKVESKGHPQKIRVTADGEIAKIISENSKIVIKESDKKGVIYRFYKINPIRGILCGSNRV